MKINLAKSAGFCFGVKRAFNIAMETAGENKKVHIFGDIVHNEDVAKQIQKAGIKKIKYLADGKNKTLLIRAHGACLKTLSQAQNLGYKIVDATCPMVKEIHRIVKDMEKKGYRIIVIGDKKHDEVHSITGQLKEKAIIIDPAAGIDWKALRNIDKACVVTQSTQNKEKVDVIIKTIRKHIKEFKFFNTICKPTKIKQLETMQMPLENDIMIIIGSKTSANTKRLYEISKSLNKKSYWVNAPGDIKPAWFKGVKTIGISAGASTPKTSIDNIIERLQKLNGR